MSKQEKEKIDNVLELLCAAINDCSDKKMKHTVETLDAARLNLESLIGSFTTE